MRDRPAAQTLGALAIGIGQRLAEGQAPPVAGPGLREVAGVQRQVAEPVEAERAQPTRASTAIAPSALAARASAWSRPAWWYRREASVRPARNDSSPSRCWAMTRARATSESPAGSSAIFVEPRTIAASASRRRRARVPADWPSWSCTSLIKVLTVSSARVRCSPATRARLVGEQGRLAGSLGAGVGAVAFGDRQPARRSIRAAAIDEPDRQRGQEQEGRRRQRGQAPIPAGPADRAADRAER